MGSSVGNLEGRKVFFVVGLVVGFTRVGENVRIDVGLNVCVLDGGVVHRIVGIAVGFCVITTVDGSAVGLKITEFVIADGWVLDSEVGVYEVGIVDGVSDGADDGADDGAALGVLKVFCVGKKLETTVGDPVGFAVDVDNVGDSDGIVEGLPVLTNTVDVIVGARDGDAEGSKVGKSVRGSEGIKVGIAVGEKVGISVGSPVGSIEGANEDIIVGESVDSVVEFWLIVLIEKKLGAFVGLRVGISVAELLGLILGIFVMVGASVNSSEGDIVG